MSPLYMDVPPLQPAIAAVGHNSRQQEVERTAAAIRLEFLTMVLRPGTSKKFEIINRAYASDMSDAEFRVLYGYMQHGNRDGGNITVGEARLAIIVGKGEQAVQRATKKLQESGWLPDPKRNRRKDATRCGAIPEHAMRAIVFEIVEQSFSTGQPLAIPPAFVPQAVVPSRTIENDGSRDQDQSDSTDQGIKTSQIRRLRPVEFDDITKEDKPSVVEGSACASLVEQDLIDYQTLFNRWGRKPGDITPGADWPRRNTDPVVLGSYRGLVGKHPPAIVLAAIRMTIASMSTRAMLDESARRGRAGFQNYFQQELVSNVAVLLRGDKAAVVPPRQQQSTRQGNGNRPPLSRQEDTKREAMLAIIREVNSREDRSEAGA